jgi:hypothetical protein
LASDAASAAATDVVPDRTEFLASGAAELADGGFKAFVSMFGIDGSPRFFKLSAMAGECDPASSLPARGGFVAATFPGCGATFA